MSNAVSSDSPTTPTERGRAAAELFFLPDFCAPRMVFAVVIISELVAISLTVAALGSTASIMLKLGATSLFIQWVGLTGAALLCNSRRWLAGLSLAKAASLSFLLLILNTLVVSEVAFWLGRYIAERFGAVTLFPQEHLLFLARTLSIGAIVSALVLRYFYVSHEWKRNVQMEARARIHALQARIRPHFLFNSMNTIASLTRTDPGRAEEAVEDLADLFRATLSEAKTKITMKEELEIARIYQRIEQLRLGPRLEVNWKVAELPMRAIVPSLTIQPLLENAIYHGIEPLPDGGVVDVVGLREDDSISITVSNPVADERMSQREGNRIALANIEQRLSLAYGGQASMDVEREPGRYRVRLCFPYLEREVV